MFEILLDRQPQKFLEKCERSLYDRLIRKLEELKKEPVPYDVKRVVGRKEPVFRLRVGKYRILYRINYEEKRVVVVKIDLRESAYLQF